MNSTVTSVVTGEFRGEGGLRTSGLQQAATRVLSAQVQAGGTQRRADMAAGRALAGRTLPAGLGPHPAAWESPGGDMPRLHLLVADEDAEVRHACGEIARRMGFAVMQAAEGPSAQTVVRHQKVDLVLLDLKISGVVLPSGGQGGPTVGGLSLLEEVKSLHPETSVIVMTASATVASAVEAMRLGAEDYLTKPFALEDLETTLERAAQRTRGNSESRVLRERLRTQRSSGPLIGHSPEMEKLYRILSKVAHSTHPVLIMGESGTGKELVARSIHFNGPQSSKPFVPVDCGSLAPNLVEGALFGYAKGAIRPAGAGPSNDAKEGLLATASGGTIFLDEIGELPLEMQAKLLRALQEKAVHPIGGAQPVPISGRVLAATNVDLQAMVEQGKFRRDLFFRLNVVSLRMPALRQRQEDIPELTQYFLEKFQRETGRGHEIADEALRAMMLYDWPGNVRELENALSQACAFSSGPVLHLAELPIEVRSSIARAQQQQAELAGAAASAKHAQGAPRIQSIAELEKQAILGTIKQLRGDKLLAAKLLGIGKTTLYRKLKEYGVRDDLEGLD